MKHDHGYWQPGDIVALRWGLDGRVLIEQPNYIVADGPDETVLLLLPGARCRVAHGIWDGAPASETAALIGDFVNGATPALREHVWRSNRLLTVLRPGVHYAIMHFWREPDFDFACYYVNFQLPFKRTPAGFETFDLELDIVIDPDLSWEWKDAESYARDVQTGVIRTDWAEAIKLAQAKVFELLAAHAYPFDGRWLNFTPDPSWSPPTLPSV
jgi:hypothetical protein